jgi:hypothetical protein
MLRKRPAMRAEVTDWADQWCLIDGALVFNTIRGVTIEYKRSGELIKEIFRPFEGFEQILEKMGSLR